MKLPLKAAAALALIASVPLLMAPTGGIPTILSLIQLTVNGQNGSANGAAFNAAATDASANGTGRAFVSRGAPNKYTGEVFGSATSGQSYGLLLQAGTNSSDVALSISNQANTLNYFKVDGGGNITAANAASFPWPKGFAALIGGGGSCSVSHTNNFGGANVSACSRTSAGVYVLTTSGFTSGTSWVCTATVNNNALAQGVVQANVSTATSVQLDINSAGTATDTNVYVICLGA